MDLTEVEGLRDLVEADTEAQRKLAARQAGVSAPLLLSRVCWLTSSFTGANEEVLRCYASVHHRGYVSR